MDWTDVVGIIVVMLGGISVLLGGLFWLIRSVVRSELASYTQPIQPGYRNGGESLADVAHEVRRIAQHIGIEEKK